MLRMLLLDVKQGRHVLLQIQFGYGQGESHLPWAAGAFGAHVLWCLYESLGASTAATLCINVITIRIQSLLWSERSLKDPDKPSSSLMEYKLAADVYFVTDSAFSMSR